LGAFILTISNPRVRGSEREIKKPRRPIKGVEERQRGMKRREAEIKDVEPSSLLSTQKQLATHWCARYLIILSGRQIVCYLHCVLFIYLFILFGLGLL
jgi:hypothetical protein